MIAAVILVLTEYKLPTLILYALLNTNVATMLLPSTRPGRFVR
jgi:hypothetical protein